MMEHRMSVVGLVQKYLMIYLMMLFIQLQQLVKIHLELIEPINKVVIYQLV